MAKWKESTQEVTDAIGEAAGMETVPEKLLPVTVVCCIDTYPHRETGEPVEYVAYKLINPFPGEDFDDVKLTPKWDADRARIKYKARKMLTAPDSTFELSGKIVPASYFNKRKRKQINYAGIFLDNPFGAGTIEFTIKNGQNKDGSLKVSDNSYIFSMLVSELWGEAIDGPESVAVDDEA